MKILIVVQLLFCVFPATNACSEIRVTAEDKSVIVGRTGDLTKDMLSNVVVEPEGYPRVAVPAEGCSHHESLLSWKNKYAVAYLDAWDQFLSADGMNSAGLSVSSLMFSSFTKYQVLQNTHHDHHDHHHHHHHHHHHKTHKVHF